MPPFFFFFFLLLSTAAQPTADSSNAGNVTISFRPGVAVIVGIFAIMFSLTFLLLVYAKFCHAAATAELLMNEDPSAANAGRTILRRSSGIDKAAIDSLPFFSFSALRGARGGLECAVCLALFDDADLLRLLPKCCHAFHVPCIDRWLEAHSTCPLCRCGVDPADASLFNLPSSAARSRFLFPSDRLDAAADLDLFVEREPGASTSGSSRFSIGGSFKSSDESGGGGGIGDAINTKPGSALELLHKFKHRIIVSDVVSRRRWSDVNSSDLLSLSADMLHLPSSKRFTELDPSQETIAGAAKLAESSEISKIKKEMEKKMLLETKAGQIYAKRNMSPAGNASASTSSSAAINGGSRALISVPGERSMSEIVNFSRFRLVRSEQTGSSVKEEKLWRIWLPIARRTVQWFVGRERRSQQGGAAHCSV